LGAFDVPQTPFTARLRDISAHGVSMMCPAVIGGEFTLEMPDAHGVAQVVKCRVVHCRKVERDQFYVGAAFTEGEAP
jgi:hypothetical protein